PHLATPLTTLPQPFPPILLPQLKFSLSKPTNNTPPILNPQITILKTLINLFPFQNNPTLQ
ncbi:hypothetical protein, partial [Bacillus altitudinis]|uniref:hypothetical protein n=1 Tax=Bacillus altitudinis TaxID=293387 RepID=UPI001C92C324